MRPYLVLAILLSVSGHLPLYAQMRLYPLEHAGAIVPGSTVKVRWAKPGEGWRYDVFVEGLQGQEQKIAEDITDTLFSYVVPPGFSNKIKFRVVGHGERGIVFGPYVDQVSSYPFTFCEDRTLIRNERGVLMISRGVFGPSVSSITKAAYDSYREPRLSCSPNGRIVAVTRISGAVLFFDADSEQQVDSIDVDEVPTGLAQGIEHRLSNDGTKYYFIAKHDDTTFTINIFDRRSRSVTATNTYQGNASSIRVHPKISWITLTTSVGDIKVYDAESLVEIDPGYNPWVDRWIRNGTTLLCLDSNNNGVLHDFSTHDDVASFKRQVREYRVPTLVSEDGLTACNSYYMKTNPRVEWMMVFTDLVTGKEVDSVALNIPSVPFLYISDDGSTIVSVDSTGWSHYVKFGSLTKVTLKPHQQGRVYFSRDLRLCRIFTKAGVINVDVLTGLQLTDTLDAGSFRATENVSFRDGAGHIGLFRDYRQGYRVINNADPFTYNSYPLTAPVTAFGANSRTDLLPIATADSVLSIVDMRSGLVTSFVRIPFSALPVIDMSKDGRRVFVGDRNTIINVRLNPVDFDTVYTADNGEAILGGMFDADREEFNFLVGNLSTNTTRIHRLSPDGVISRSDSVLRSISPVVNIPISFNVVNGGTSLLVGWPGFGFVYVDRATHKPQRIYNDRLFDQLLDCNDSIAILAYDNKLALIDHRTGFIDSLRPFSNNRTIRGGAFTQNGSRITIYEWASGAQPPYTTQSRVMLLHFDSQKHELIDSMELPERFSSACNFFVLNDDCTLLVHSGTDMAVRWNSCENKPWEGSVAGTVGAPTSVYSGAEDHSEMNMPVISLSNGTLSIYFEGISITNVRLVDQLGRTVVYSSLGGNDSRAEINVGQLSSAMYFVCVNNRYTIPIVSIH